MHVEMFLMAVPGLGPARACRSIRSLGPIGAKAAACTGQPRSDAVSHLPTRQAIISWTGIRRSCHRPRGPATFKGPGHQAPTPGGGVGLSASPTLSRNAPGSQATARGAGGSALVIH
jgi:hypothetical protein